MAKLKDILKEIKVGGYNVKLGQVVTYKDMPAFKTEAQIRKEEEDCEDVSEGKIRIQDDEDFSWWSDRYKEEVGNRPRMSNAELEKWANNNFKLKGKEYVPINENKNAKEWRVSLYEDSYQFDQFIHKGNLESAKKVARKKLQKQYAWKKTDATLWAAFSFKDENKKWDEDFDARLSFRDGYFMKEEVIKGYVNESWTDRMSYMFGKSAYKKGITEPIKNKAFIKYVSDKVGENESSLQYVQDYMQGFKSAAMEDTIAAFKKQNIGENLNESKEFVLLKIDGRYEVHPFNHYYTRKNDEFKKAINMGFYKSEKDARKDAVRFEDK